MFEKDIESLNLEELKNLKKEVNEYLKSVKNQIKLKSDTFKEELYSLKDKEEFLKYLKEHLLYIERTYGTFDYRKNMMDYSGIKLAWKNGGFDEIRNGSNWCSGHTELDQGKEPGFNDEYNIRDEIYNMFQSFEKATFEDLVEIEKDVGKLDLIVYILAYGMDWV